MKVITLFENRTISKEFKSNHGLSLYIETSNHKILFDTGSDASFAYNAKKLGVNLEDVDIAVISHGHYDHGGGLKEFLKINNKAKIYLGMGSFDSHFVKVLGVFKYNIGLMKELINNRMVFVDGILKIDNLIFFNDIKGKKLLPKGNDKLLKKYEDNTIKKDDFHHEINLLVNENNNYTLFCGCAHRGIVNIIDTANNIIDDNLKTVIGGFHLMGMNIKNSSNQEFFDKLSNKLSNNSTLDYYTCHCTGEQPFKYLSEKMNNINDLKTGMIIDI